MSGIVGAVYRDGAPVDGALVRALAHFLGFRGPDERSAWCSGPVGLGHAMLRTTTDCPNETQPASLEGRYWITADARLDRREELIAELEAAGRAIHGPIADSELVLHSYAVWKEGCVEHLFGDFAFGVWDARERRLFCARDHFGIKPFYYAELRSALWFSNTLNCLRAIPEIPDELNEAAIVDFLLYGTNCENDRTTFRYIRRLPPAHWLTASSQGIQIRHYWSAPTEDRIRYHRADDYVEHFQILLQEAVRDRLRTDTAGILLSGGLDSASVAAAAHELSVIRRGSSKLHAYTTVCGSEELEGEAALATQVAEFLHIPIHCHRLDHIECFEGWMNAESSPPEPVEDPFFAGLQSEFQRIGADCRVVLSGEGSDNLMDFELWPYLKDLLRTGKWKTAASILPLYWSLRPPTRRGIARRVNKAFSMTANGSEFPRWFKSDSIRRIELEDRWKAKFQPHANGNKMHPIRPRGHFSLSLPQWTRFFELENPGVTRQPVEVRYPFLDLRIVSYLLAIPPFPWFLQKMLLREAMVGRLPESIRRRPKSSIKEDPLLQGLGNEESKRLPDIGWADEIDRYVDRHSANEFRTTRSVEKLENSLRPLCLNFWLQSAWRVRYNLRAEARHG